MEDKSKGGKYVETSTPDCHKYFWLFTFEHFICGIMFKVGVHGLQSYSQILKILSNRNIIILESYLKLNLSHCQFVLFLRYKE